MENEDRKQKSMENADDASADIQLKELRRKNQSQKETIKQLEEIQDKHGDITTALTCKLESSKRRLRTAYRDIKVLEKEKESLAIENNRLNTTVSRYAAKIDELEQSLERMIGTNSSEKTNTEQQIIRISALEENKKTVTVMMDNLKEKFTVKKSEWEQSQKSLQMELNSKIKAIQQFQEEIAVLKQQKETSNWCRTSEPLNDTKITSAAVHTLKEAQEEKTEADEWDDSITDEESQADPEKQSPKTLESAPSTAKIRGIDSDVALFRLQREHMKCEGLHLAVMAMKDRVISLPPPRIDHIQWVSEKKRDTTTNLVDGRNYILRRSELMQKYKTKIQGLASDPCNPLCHFYQITNNPISQDGWKWDDVALANFTRFVQENGTGNMHPMVVTEIDPIIQNPKYTMTTRFSLDLVVGIRLITECAYLPSLIGKKECFAKMDIEEGTLLGQYIGTEMLGSEYFSIYYMTNEEKDHLKYCLQEKLLLPDGVVIDINIDPIAFVNDEISLSPLIYINENSQHQRIDTAEEKRLNTEFVSVLCDGWPMLLVQTTKFIEKGESLWIDYETHHKSSLDEIECIGGD